MGPTSTGRRGEQEPTSKGIGGKRGGRGNETRQWIPTKICCAGRWCTTRQWNTPGISVNVRKRPTRTRFSKCICCVKRDAVHLDWCFVQVFRHLSAQQIELLALWWSARLRLRLKRSAPRWSSLAASAFTITYSVNTCHSFDGLIHTDKSSPIRKEGMKFNPFKGRYANWLHLAIQV